MDMEELFRKPAFLIDIFPKTVPPKADGRYFEAERFFQRSRREIFGRFTAILMKLYCYHDMELVTEEGARPAEARLLADLVDDCESRRLSYVHFFLPEEEVLITLFSGDLYMTVYNSQGALSELISQLAGSEGLFFYQAPAV